MFKKDLVLYYFILLPEKNKINQPKNYEINKIRQLFDPLGSVSYTHLDVYKRQIRERYKCHHTP